jgi:hypothetical protein
MSAHPAPTDRRRRWRTFLVAWAGVVAVPLLGGRLIHVALAALVAAVFSVVWWWLADVGSMAEEADWSTVSGYSLRGRGADPRASRLQRMTRDVLTGNNAVGSDVVLAHALVDIIDERVLAHHGIDRVADPERYAVVVGSDLAAFVEAVAGDRATVRSHQLPALISRIEHL